MPNRIRKSALAVRGGEAPRRISYQGEPGANSHLACTEVYPDFAAVACPTFEDALAAVKSGEVGYAMIPAIASAACQ